MSETPVHAAPEPGKEEPGGDPWAAFGYLVAGVLFYGAIGWVLSLWLHAAYWIPIGILVGAAFGMYMVFARFRLRPTDPVIAGPDPQEDEAARRTRPASDDRGETA